MKILRHQRASQAAFTMAELALCIAVVAIAMVAIIGVLPLGLNVQKQNREDTIINQDAQILLDALKTAAVSGAPLTNEFRSALVLADRLYQFSNRADSLTNFVDYVAVENRWGRSFWRGPWYTQEIGGLSGDPDRPPLLDGHLFLNALLMPRVDFLNGRFVTNVVFAQMRPISGPLAEQPESLRRRTKEDAARRYETLFRYIVSAELSQANPLSPDLQNGPEFERLRNLTNGLYELRLTFQWPVTAQVTDVHVAGKQPSVGPNRRTFRTTLAGRIDTKLILNRNNDPIVAEVPGQNAARVPLREFKPLSFVRTQPL